MLDRLEALAREAERMPWEKDASDVPYGLRKQFHDGITPEDVLKLRAVVKAAQRLVAPQEMASAYHQRAQRAADEAALRLALVELERE